MRHIRLLLVSASETVRTMVSEILPGDAVFKGAVLATSDVIALALLESVRPDLMLLDLGTETEGRLRMLSLVRKQHPRVRIVIMAPPTEAGYAALLEGTFRGADECISGPACDEDLRPSACLLRDQLLDRARHIIPRQTGPCRPILSTHRVDLRRWLVRDGQLVRSTLVRRHRP